MIFVKKFFPFIGTAIIFGFGLLLRMSHTLSQKAAWSYIISSVNDSTWELYKPFAIVYIFFIIIELSYLRPSLLHFVCSKLVGMYILCGAILAGGMLCRFIPLEMKYSSLIMAAIGICVAQAVSYCLNKSTIKVEILWVPLLFSLAAMFMLLLTLTFYPPHWGVFYDFIANQFGRISL